MTIRVHNNSARSKLGLLSAGIIQYGNDKVFD